jgi:hypothetical protein
MSHKLAIAVIAAVSFGVAAIPIGAMAAHGGGGGGHVGGGAPGGGRGISGGPGFSGRGMLGGNSFVNRGVGSNPFVSRGVVGQPFVSRGVAGNPLVGRGVPSAAPFVAHRVSGDRRFAFIGNRRVHGRHLHGFIPGIGYAYYWYYDDCYVLTDEFGWINICGYQY